MIRRLFQNELRGPEFDAMSGHGGSRRTKKNFLALDSSSRHTGPVPSRQLCIGSSIHVRAVARKQAKNTQAIINHERNVLSGSTTTTDDDGPSFEEVQARACDMARKQYEGDLRINGIRDYSNQFPVFSRKEILEGRNLGRGSTCVVAQLNGFRTRPDLRSESSPLSDPHKGEKADQEGEEVPKEQLYH